MAKIKRWLARAFLCLFLLLSALSVVFGLFKYSERRVVAQAGKYLERSEPYKAVEIFKNFEANGLSRLAIKHEVVDPLWHYTYGLALLKTSDYVNAAKESERAAYGFKDNKEKSLAYFNFGEARLWQWDGGAFEEAALLYQEALKYDFEMVMAKKRLEWLRMANLIKGESSGNPKDKGKGDLNNDKADKSDGKSQSDEEKFKQTNEKRRRGY